VSKHTKAGGQGSDARRPGGVWDEVAEAAQEVARGLRRSEELTAAACRIPLDTHKAIQRAAKAAGEAAAAEEELGRALGGLLAAITSAHETQKASVAALAARSEEIARRAEAFTALAARYAALGEEGAQINRLVQDAAGAQREATTPEKVRELVTAIAGIEERMGRLVEEAREVGQAAAAASFEDVTAQAASLRQQVAAARNKMALLRKELEGRGTSG
jgi:hypothetical protein